MTDRGREDIARLATALAGRYTIERELGQGGMATVYLAHDIKHERRVAIKVLRPELAAVIGAERFLREIKTIATLQHPHILGLIDSGEVNGTAYYVMPFVEGESLRDRLNREKQLPINDAVRLATEVAGALDYAHRHGVIHRDIKPENILLHDGSALVADFGIALAVSSAGGGSRMTETGMSLGTPHYMSPEQAMGEREITARSDVYALGAVTYEMLIGDPPFTGSTVQAIVAKVMTTEPAGLIAQRRNVPPAVEDAVLTALEKLPADRFASAAEFAAALHGTAASSQSAVRRAGKPSAARSRVPLIVATAASAIALLLAALLFARRAPAVLPLRASLMEPRGCEYGTLENVNLVQVSPDGQFIAFVAICGSSPSLWIRSLATGEARRLPGTDNAGFPFWAPTSQSLAFFADTKLKRVDLATGAVQEIATVVAGRGGTWSRNDVILYAPDIAGPLYRVPATGGTPVVVTSMPADSQRLLTDRNPTFLPDGEHFVYAHGRAAGTIDAGSTRFGRLGSTDSKLLLTFASNVAYAGGRLLFGRKNLLMAQRFDPKSGALSGQPETVVSGVEWWAFKFLENFSPSSDGRLLVYRLERAVHNRIEWLDPKSGATLPILPAGPYASVRVSHDQRSLLIERSAPDDPQVDGWIYDIGSGGWARLTSKASVYYSLVWSPDDRRIAYSNADDSVTVIRFRDGSSTDTLRDLAFINESVSEDWSPDGKSLLGWRQVKATGFDIIRQAIDSNTSHVVYSTQYNEAAARLSRDGRFVAYSTDRTGRYELFVTTMPNPTAQWQVSQDGVAVASGFRFTSAWGPGGLLYFINASHQLMVASVGAGGNITRPAPVRGAPPNVAWFDVATDGRIVLVAGEAGESEPLSLIQNWARLLGK